MDVVERQLIMAEPATQGSSIAATAMKSAMSGGATSALLPFDPLTMAVGLVAALIALLHITPPDSEARTPLRIFAMVAGSGFLAGVFVPIAVAGGTNYLPWIASAGDRATQMAAAALIGAAPHVLPTLWRLWQASKGAKP